MYTANYNNWCYAHNVSHVPSIVELCNFKAWVWKMLFMTTPSRDDHKYLSWFIIRHIKPVIIDKTNYNRVSNDLISAYIVIPV